MEIGWLRIFNENDAKLIFHFIFFHSSTVFLVSRSRVRRQTANEVATRLVAVSKSKPELLSTAVANADPDLLRVALTDADPKLLEVALTKASPDLLQTALTSGVDGNLLRVISKANPRIIMMVMTRFPGCSDPSQTRHTGHCPHSR